MEKNTFPYDATNFVLVWSPVLGYFQNHSEQEALDALDSVLLTLPETDTPPALLALRKMLCNVAALAKEQHLLQEVLSLLEDIGIEAKQSLTQEKRLGFYTSENELLAFSALPTQARAQLVALAAYGWAWEEPEPETLS